MCAPHWASAGLSVKHLPVKSVPLQYLTVDPRAIPTREAERIKNLKLVNCIGEFVLKVQIRYELAGFLYHS
jgi:hypothetical protein